MDIMVIAAFVAFFALVVAWLAAPTSQRPVVESASLQVSELPA